MKHKVLAAVTFVTGFALSASAAWYSIIGLTAIFPGATNPIIILGANLEVAKLVVVSWLYHNWEDISKTIKTLLVASTAILMLITSMGIFGFLSKAHIEQQLKLETGIVDKIEMLNSKLSIKEDELKDLDKQIAVIDGAISKLTETGQVKSALSANDAQKKNRASLLEKKQRLVDEMTPMKEERVKYQSEIKKQEAEVGPIKYVAELIYGTTDEKILDKSVRFVIILLIFVFDPLAILLLLAFNISLNRNQYGIEFLDIKNEHLLKPKRGRPKKETHGE